MAPLRPDDPRTIGPYRLGERLGQGGMGQVFLAESPGGRQVAVKLIRPEHAADARFRERFAREVEAARKVGGFHTAQVVDADPAAATPWMATAFVPGESLRDEVARGGPLPPDRVRALGAALAEGLAAIHDHGLVHRDLKPGNVIMSPDGPRIIDFGIARAADAAPMTSEGAVIGTYAFMSPEQVLGDRVETPSDVFALGCVLTFAATGRGPFDATTIPAIVHRILREGPRLDGVDEGLRTLLAACLAKEPAARPTTSVILEHLADPAANPLPEPAAPVTPAAPAVPAPDAPTQLRGTMAETKAVGADAPTSPATRGRQVPRRALVIGAAGAVAAAMTAVPAALLLLGDDEESPAANAAVPTPAAPLAPYATLSGHEAGVEEVALSPDGRFAASVSLIDDRAIIWDVRRRAEHRSLRVAGGAAGVAFSPDGRRLATGNMNASATVWDVATGRRIRDFRVDAFNVSSVAFSPDGRILAGGNPDVRLWDVRTGRVVAGFDANAKAGIRCVGFSPDGKIVAAAYDGASDPEDRGEVRMWDVATRRGAGALRSPEGAMSSLAFAPDGRTVATACESAEITLWDRASRKIAASLSGHAGRITQVAFSADGKRLVSGGQDRQIRVWDLATRRTTAVLSGLDGTVSTVAVSGDGTTVAAGSATGGDRTVRLWRVS
ncbi:serine/threonine protein kinase [Actinomadura sp. KC345]|uniref:WD40 repeat domain-containing serine/threonine protein kinase n=1 Tax=Actinomadura sp. KC345 TaxID=2530371 RepID=UPI00104C6871|nr:serine/threonine-protein kinase [Actinomadura sp. KC345]TDC53685.1 serine/threonine protein kinase [Actinomadura sp. KC345]